MKPKTGGKRSDKMTKVELIDWSKPAEQPVDEAVRAVKGSNTPTQRPTCQIKEEELYTRLNGPPRTSRNHRHKPRKIAASKTLTTG